MRCTLRILFQVEKLVQFSVGGYVSKENSNGGLVWERWVFSLKNFCKETIVARDFLCQGLCFFGGDAFGLVTG